jgi:hypothetical protein
MSEKYMRILINIACKGLLYIKRILFCGAAT